MPLKSTYAAPAQPLERSPTGKAPEKSMAAGFSVAPEQPDAESIRPMYVNFSEAAVDDLRRRINATMWPERQPSAEQLQDLKFETIQKIAVYWGSAYDWRRCEAALNALPNFVTEIDGLDIHFIRVRSHHEGALPIILTHGWPGSILWMLKLIEPLTNPTAHGRTPADAFDVVIPSIPGFGFSGKPVTSGWDCPRTARAWTVLMKRLGYTHFVAQGGDWGALITEQMAVQAPAELLGIHSNMPAAVPIEISTTVQLSATSSRDQSDEDRAVDRLAYFFQNSLSYAQQMANHPRSLYGIVDSPVGLACWFLDNDLWGPGFVERVFDGQGESLTRDDLLDNITLTWLTDTALSGARIYRENQLPFFAPKGITIPVAVSAFPGEIFQCPRSWAEQAYSDLIYYNKPAKGGHFAPWEQPTLFANELTAAFKPLRTQKREDPQ